MDNFDSGQKKVKEKSVYLLHLDTPRMIILGSAIIGLLIISFLIGMNYFKEEGGSGKVIANNDILNDKNKDMGFIDKSSSLQNENKDPNGKGDDLDSKTGLSDSENKITERIEKGKKEAVDVLNSDNINEIVPSVKKHSADKKENAGRDTSKEKKVSRNKKNSDKNIESNSDDGEKVVKKKSKKKSKVIEVSDDAERSTAKHGTFTIQVAAYDKKSKANDEVKALKEMKYNAYVNTAEIQGRKHYRVKIGPVASKTNALKLLNEVQEISKYSESFMVKE